MENSTYNTQESCVEGTKSSSRALREGGGGQKSIHSLLQAHTIQTVSNLHSLEKSPKKKYTRSDAPFATCTSQTMWTPLFPNLTLCAGFESVIFVFGPCLSCFLRICLFGPRTKGEVPPSPNSLGLNWDLNKNLQGQGSWTGWGVFFWKPVK